MGTNRYCVKCGLELPSGQIRSCPGCGAAFGVKTKKQEKKVEEARKCNIKDELNRDVKRKSPKKASTWSKVWPIIVIVVILYLAFYLISWAVAQNALNYVVRVCEESGIDSSSCVRAQSDKGVSCSKKNIFGVECTKEYTTFTPYFY